MIETKLKKMYIEYSIKSNDFLIIDLFNFKDIKKMKYKNYVLNFLENENELINIFYKFIQEYEIKLENINLYIFRKTKIDVINNLLIIPWNLMWLETRFKELEFINSMINKWLPVVETRWSKSGESFVYHCEFFTFTIKYWHANKITINGYKDENYKLYIKVSDEDIEEIYPYNKYVRLKRVKFKFKKIEPISIDNMKMINVLEVDSLSFSDFNELREKSNILVKTLSTFRRWTVEYYSLPKKAQKLYDFVKENKYECSIIYIYREVFDGKWVYFKKVKNILDNKSAKIYKIL